MSSSVSEPGTGYTAFVDVAALKQSAHHQQKSEDKTHETVMVTFDGRMYTKP